MVYKPVTHHTLAGGLLSLKIDKMLEVFEKDNDKYIIILQTPPWKYKETNEMKFKLNVTQNGGPGSTPCEQTIDTYDYVKRRLTRHFDSKNEKVLIISCTGDHSSGKCRRILDSFQYDDHGAYDRVVLLTEAFIASVGLNLHKAKSLQF